MPPTPPEPTSPPPAELHLRSPAGALPVGILWPDRPARGTGVALLYDGGLSSAATAPVTGVLRRSGLLVVRAHSARTGDDAVTAAEWVAERGRELGGDPARLVVAGVGRAASLAVAVAVEARTNGWPPIAAQVLILPKLPGAGVAVGAAGVAPAIVVRSPGRTDADAYVERLRAGGVGVDEVLFDLSDPERVERELDAALRRALP